MKGLLHGLVPRERAGGSAPVLRAGIRTRVAVFGLVLFPGIVGFPSLGLLPSPAAAQVPPPGSAAGAGGTHGEEIGALVAALGDDDTAPEARRSLQRWIREQPPERQRPWLHLAATLEGVDRVAGFVAAQATLLAEGDPLPFGRGRDDVRQEGAALLEGFVVQRGEEGSAAAPALLALAAFLVEPADPVGAQRLRQQALSALDAPARVESPDAGVARSEDLLPPVWPRLVLAEARYLLRGGEPGGRIEARQLLEDFLVRAPLHPQAPEARRLLGGIPRPPIPDSASDLPPVPLRPLPTS